MCNVYLFLEFDHSRVCSILSDITILFKITKFRELDLKNFNIIKF